MMMDYLIVLYESEGLEVWVWAQRIIWLVWLGALSLLALKLLWRPLDKATTYGKLLTNTPSRFTVSRSSSQEENVGGGAMNHSPSSPPHHHPLSTHRPLSSPLLSQPYRSIFTQQFGFTSGYIVGLLALIVMIILSIWTIWTFHLLLTHPGHFHCPPSGSTIQIRQYLGLPALSTNKGVHYNEETRYSEVLGQANSNPTLPARDTFQLNSNPLKMENTMVNTQSARHNQDIMVTRPTLCGMFRASQAFFYIPFLQAPTMSYATITKELLETSIWSVRGVVIAILLLLHMARRIYECYFVHIFSHRAMTASNILLIWGYYIFMPTVVVTDILVGHMRYSVEVPETTMTLFQALVHGASHIILPYLSLVIGVILCIVGNYVQNRSHHVLANLRTPYKAGGGKKEGDKSNYSVPHGGHFEYVSCPHYLSEWAIYTGFGFICGWKNGVLLLGFFVGVTMITQALKTHAWYIKSFRTFPRHRKAILPMLL